MRWERIADIPTVELIPATESEFFTDGQILQGHDGQLWLLGAFDPSVVFSYSPSLNTWTEHPSFPSTPIDGFPTKIFTAAWVGDVLYYICRHDGPSPPARFEVFTFDPINDVRVSILTDATGTSLDNATPDFNLTSRQGAVRDYGAGPVIEWLMPNATGCRIGRYSIDANTLSYYDARADEPTHHFTDATVASDGTALYVCGGFFYPPSTRNGVVNEIVAFDGSASFPVIMPFEVGFEFAAATVLNGKLWLISGWYNELVDDFDEPSTVYPEDNIARPYVHTVDVTSGEVLLHPTPAPISPFGSNATTVDGVIYYGGGVTGGGHWRLVPDLEESAGDGRVHFRAT